GFVMRVRRSNDQGREIAGFLDLRMDGRHMACLLLRDYRRSRNPRPAKIAGIALSIRAVRVADCFAPVKSNRYPLCRPGVSASNALLNRGSIWNFAFNSAGRGNSRGLVSTFRPAFAAATASRR